MACNNILRTAVQLCFIVAIPLVIASSADDDLHADDVIEDVINEKDGDDVAVEVNAGDMVEEGEKRTTLSQLDPVEVGYVREIEVGPGRTVEIKTVAIKPPAFEIYNLLTPDECDHLIKIGEDKGLHRSMTISSNFNQRYGLYAEDGVTLAYNETEWNQTFNHFDLNLDGTIDYIELQRCLPVLEDRDVELNLAQVIKLLTDLDLDSDSNGVLDLNEFWAMMNRSMEDQVDDWLRRLQAGEIETDEKLKGQHRISDQTWVPFVSSDDKVLSELPYRISALTGLHPDIIRSSESIQVARYYPGGYYHAHYDTMEIDPATSCIQSMMTLQDVPHTHPKGRMCRYITIMTYLNDVEEGGETAFPLADNATYNTEVFNEHQTTMTDLKNHCYDANMVIHPAKGKTVMWYNHHLDPETGWLGALDNYALHGGCKVTRGVKWIANNWISVDDIYSQQVEFHEKYFTKHAKQGSEPVPTTAISSIERETSNEESSIGTGDDTRSSSDDVKGELRNGRVDESRGTATGSDEPKVEL